MKKAVVMLVLLVLLSSFVIGQEIPEDLYEDVETIQVVGKLGASL